MRSLLLTILIVLNLSACKKGEYDPESVVGAIVGKWRLVSYQEQQPNGDLVWVEIETGTGNLFEFRDDGALLDAAGYVYCCSPAAFDLNGKRFKSVHPDDVRLAPLCAASLCAACETWQMEMQEDVLLINSCSPFGAKHRYEREE